jgi:hypothetical protein
MKVRTYSWILAASYLLCGVMFFVVVAKFQAILSELEVPLPLLTRAVFLVGPLGWLTSAVVVAVGVVLKDLRFRSRFLNPLFTVILFLAVGSIVVAPIVAVLDFEQGLPVTPQQRLEHSIGKLTAAKGEKDRFYTLCDAAKESFVAGNIEDARKYAEELMALLPRFQDNWNYGNAIHDANVVLGRIAVHEGRINDARRYLIEAGKSPGSPQLDSFGPNMSLAKDLLEKGEREVVVEYFEECRKFWKMDNGDLDKWSQQAKDGKIPDFGPNLVY